MGVGGRPDRGVRYWGGRQGYHERLAKGKVGLASVAHKLTAAEATLGVPE